LLIFIILPDSSFLIISFLVHLSHLSLLNPLISFNLLHLPCLKSKNLYPCFCFFSHFLFIFWPSISASVCIESSSVSPSVYLSLLYCFPDLFALFILLYYRFTSGEVSSKSQAKSSVQRNIRKSVLDSYPGLAFHLDTLMPKKTPLYVVKCSGHVSLVVVNKDALFFQLRDGPFLPTLKLLHRFPDLLPKVQVDRGAIKRIMNASNIKCPGLTSAGAKMEEEIEAGKAVAVMAEGKENALAVGQLVLSTADIRKINRDDGVETLHYLGDGLWNTQEFDL
jgi:PUA domain protein